MSTRTIRNDVLDEGRPFLGIMLLWIVVTAIVYGAFVFAWPSIPEAEPWIHLGVYLFPLIGYLGHTARQALTARPPGAR